MMDYITDNPVTNCMFCGGFIPGKYDLVYINHMNDHHRAFVNIELLFYLSFLDGQKLETLFEEVKLERESQSPVVHVGLDRKSTRLNSSHSQQSRMPSSA